MLISSGNLSFRVFINDIELVKPFDFPISGRIEKSKEFSLHTFQESMQTSEGKLSFKGYIYSQHGIINPKEYIGIIVRIRNVAIGGIDRTFLGYPSGTNQLFRNWIFGEIYVDQGLENAMNINRNKFKITSPDYVALVKWLHDFLTNVVFRYTLKEYYQKDRENRKKTLESHNLKTLRDIVESGMGSTYDLRLSRLAENQPLTIDNKTRVITVNTNYLRRQIPRKIRGTVERMLLIFEIAVEKSNGNPDELRKTFREQVEKWIGK
jgi:hypothetical protein